MRPQVLTQTLKLSVHLSVVMEIAKESSMEIKLPSLSKITSEILIPSNSADNGSC